MEVLPPVFFTCPQDLPTDCSSLSLDSNGRSVVIGHEAGGYISDIENQCIVSEISCVKAEISSVKFAKNDPHMFFCSSEKQVFQFDIRTDLSSEVKCFSYNHDDINSIDLTEQHLAAVDDTGECAVVDLAVGRPLRTLRKQHTNICSVVKFIPNRRDELVTGGYDSKLLHWNYQRIKVLQSINTQNLLSELGDDSVYMFNPPFVYSFDVNGNFSRAACGLANGFIQIFELRKGGRYLHPSILFNKHSTTGVTSVHFMNSADEKQTVISAGHAGMVYIWQPNAITTGKKFTVSNSFYSDEDVNQMMLAAVDVKSKVNFISTATFNSDNFLFVCDQTSCVKMYPLK